MVVARLVVTTTSGHDITTFRCAPGRATMIAKDFMPSSGSTAGWGTATTIAAIALLFVILLICGVVWIASRCTPSSRVLALDDGDSEVSTPPSHSPANADAGATVTPHTAESPASAFWVEPCLAASAVHVTAPFVCGSGSTPPSSPARALDATKGLQLAELRSAS